MKTVSNILKILFLILIFWIIFYLDTYLIERGLLWRPMLALIYEIPLLIVSGVIIHNLITNMNSREMIISIVLIILINILFLTIFLNTSLYGIYAKYYKVFQIFLMIAGLMIGSLLLRRNEEN